MASKKTFASWNYRLTRHTTKAPHPVYDADETEFAIREVHYDHEGWTSPVPPVVPTSLKCRLNAM